MTLKQLYEDFTAEEIKEVLGNYVLTNPVYRMQNDFEDYVSSLWICPECGEINEEENMMPHVWDISGNEEYICESCRNNEVL